MSLLDKLEKWFGRFAIPHVPLAIIVCQVVVYVGMFVDKHRPDRVGLVERVELIPDKVLEGEVWRLVTFLMIPPTTILVFALFAWYMFWMMGNALETHWGTFRLNLFFLSGYLATVGVSFITPEATASDSFLMGSVFLAFAWLYPNFELYIFFIIPVKIKWLALITWIGYGVSMIIGDWTTRLLVLASISNFILFFGYDILERIKLGRRRMLSQAAQINIREPDFFHRCTVCGITDRTHPKMDFRYCSKCDGTQGFCMNHLNDHEHVDTAKTG